MSLTAAQQNEAKSSLLDIKKTLGLLIQSDSEIQQLSAVTSIGVNFGSSGYNIIKKDILYQYIRSSILTKAIRTALSTGNLMILVSIFLAYETFKNYL